ncbi:Spaf_1101 family AAA-like ATPase [Cytobacillus kochii]|uniref:Spaf_1101 family AAA-like ATPase n=1 Tax=Cytobacillus kochii TaxID=859143 RepID=UPI00402AF257
MKKVYKEFELLKESYGRLHKCEFHIHTPASYDYRLITGKKFKSITLKDVLEIARDEEYLSDDLILKIQQNTTEENEQLVKELNEKSNTSYKDLREVIAYELIANRLYINNIEIAVISDHNTIKGFKNLRDALIRLYNTKYKAQQKKCIRLFLGIEISCSDRYHLVAIFNEANYATVSRFVEEYIHSEEDGTYISCLDMVKKVLNHGGIPYIAHINTNDLLGTDLYKRSLFDSSGLFIVGLTNTDSNKKIFDRIEPFSANVKKNFCCINEGDSHELSQIGLRNTWIKFNSINFNSLKKAFNDHHVCVYRERPKNNDKFIKGLYIVPGEDGFLTSKEDTKSPFIVDFSRDLNCIIGGRGVGKSTILSILETVFTLEVKDKKNLKFICKNKIIYISFYFKGDDYIVQFIPQVGSIGYTESFFLEKAFKDGVVTDTGLNLAPHWIELYKVVAQEKDEVVFEKIEQNCAIILLNEVYKKSFSINNIIEQINSGNVNDFIREIILNGNKFNSINKYTSLLQQCNNNNFRKILRSEMKNMINDLADRNKQVYNVIKEFNEKNTNLIQVTNSSTSLDPSEYFDFIGINSESHVANTYLTWNDIEKYLYTIVKKMNYLQFLDLLLNKKHNVLEEAININSFVSNMSTGGFDEINRNNLRKIYNSIESKLFENKDRMIASLSRFLDLQDDYTLMFNINSKESVQSTSVLMREIETLSLGQKVVAILTFIFNFGEHSLDSTPLVIDQPEDNLDNQYIFKNLVESLKKIKNSRQVIISTHSSTIVTNADAEQVIVLDSNNTNGWLVKKGYPGDKVIIKHILTILEGGEQSFSKKAKTYRNVLNV